MDAVKAGATPEQLLRLALLPPLEMRMLLCHVLHMTRTQLITQSQRTLTHDEAYALLQWITRRHNGEPMAYLLGEREFFGLPFQVNPQVLIPRPETELLVELAIHYLPPHGRLLDAGCGCGAIAVALVHARPDAVVYALDISQAALSVADENARRNNVRIHFLQSDWLAVLAAQNMAPFDLIVSNPPYIVANDVHLSQGDLRFEPLDALTDHADGLSALRTLCHTAPTHLQTGGMLLMEHGYHQAASVRLLLEENGFGKIKSWHDLAGIERASGGWLA